VAGAEARPTGPWLLIFFKGGLDRGGGIWLYRKSPLEVGGGGGRFGPGGPLPLDFSGKAVIINIVKFAL
jgi:hypothetical protein